jgi:nitroimidazol reductase NimA-like FMN-containing flavoprotein (pyridoxamine 5'-phosphate oxidase superfamily)
MADELGWEITIGHAIVPEGYTLADREQRLLDWSHVTTRMTETRNYWIATTRPNGKPHVAPTWAVWHANCLYFDGSPETRRMRNLAANPRVAVHLEDGDQAVIVEGVVTTVEQPSRELGEQLAPLYAAKYAALGYAPEPDSWNDGGLYVVEPDLALAWTEFGVDMTRWRIRRAADASPR